MTHFKGEAMTNYIIVRCRDYLLNAGFKTQKTLMKMTKFKKLNFLN